MDTNNRNLMYKLCNNIVIIFFVLTKPKHFVHFSVGAQESVFPQKLKKQFQPE